MSDSGIFLVCFRNQELALFKRRLFEDIFSRGAFIPSSRYSDIDYTDGFTDVFIEDADEISGMSFHRSWGDTFLSNVLELADRTASCIIEPCNMKLIVTDRAVLTHLPNDFPEHTTYVVRTPQAFREAIASIEPSPETVARQLAESAADRAQGAAHPNRYWPFTAPVA